MKKKKCVFGLFIFITAAFFSIAADVKLDDKPETIEKQKPLPPIPPAAYEEFFGSRIQRTMTLLHTSNKKHHNKVKILFYGQSITASSWSGAVMSQLKTRFPEADLIMENRAIGGFTAPTLQRPAVHDLYPFYPDLVVFHVYGGAYTGEFEGLISNIRRYTTSEIILFTHHIRPSESNIKNDDITNDAIIMLAQKYNCELVELRKEWRQYINDNNLDAGRFLADGTHPNNEGNKLFAAFVGRHFRFNPLFQCGWTDTVRTYNPKHLHDYDKADEIIYTGEPWKKVTGCVVGTSSNSIMKLKFEGNRVDIIAGESKKKNGTATILIDGKSPSSYMDTCVFTRPSKAYKSWMPAIRRVTHNTPLIPEDWTLRITKINERCSRFSFDVIGSVTGLDGHGNNKETFISNSGRVVIKSSDLIISWVAQFLKKGCPLNFEVTWKAIPLFVDIYKPPVIEDDAKVYRTTVVQGISNMTHTLEIIPNGDGDVPISEIQVYQPPLR